MKNNNLIINEGLELASSKWKRYTDAIVEGYKHNNKGRVPDSNILATTAIMLENTQKMIRKMDETTRVVNLGNFIDYGFGIITAVMPSLVANEIVSVQPLKARTGEIFFLDFKYGSNKGAINAGSSMISPLTGASNDTTYSSEEVSGEEFATSGIEANPVAITGNLSYLPVRPGTVSISDGTHTYIDDGDGNLGLKSGTNADFVSGRVEYTTGHVTINLSKVDAETNFIASYNFDFANQNVNSSIPEVDIALSSATITTVGRKLRARWLFDAAFELQQTHGVDADAELSTAMASEIRHEIDGEIMSDLYNSASAGNVQFSWSKTAPQGVPFIDYKDTFVDLLITMSNAIFADTKRAEGNFIIAGINVCSIIESLGGRFVPEVNGLKAGPHIIGTLDGRWKVIKNPFYGADQFLVGYKGQSYLEGGYVYAPYLPVYTTPTVMLDDFVNRKGVATRYGKKIINPKFYAKGVITG